MEESAYHRLINTTKSLRPEVALVLGSGMGAVALRLEPLHALPFEQCPGLAPPSVAGHNGWLTLGDWAGRRVLVFEGRLHFYEGHPWDLVTAPIRTAAALVPGAADDQRRRRHQPGARPRLSHGRAGSH